MDIEALRAAPFHLDDAALRWVAETFASLSDKAKIGQIVLPLCRDISEAAIDAVLAYEVGGLHRMPARALADMRASAAYAQSRSRIPLLLPTDIEFSEKSSVGGGTPFPNQLAVAATDDVETARRMGLILGREGGYVGFNASWTPVVDLALNHRSNVVNTRSFGSDVARVIALARAYHDGASAAGFPKVAKHWPGDGLDDRDQHFATTHNTLDMATWRSTFGAVYAAAIADGVQMIMAGHITLPAYTAELGAAARAPAWMPATLNADLNLGLLRGELGYNGVIVSDATGMVGFNARGLRRDLVPLCIESGCDILLFPDDLAEDIGHLEAGLASGALSRARLDDAVLRVLALKASMGLHRKTAWLVPESERHQRHGSAEHADWAADTARRAVTLVKDTQHLLPLDPARHRRLLIAQLDARFSPTGPLPQLAVGERLAAAGFEVLYHTPGTAIDPESYDVGLYLLAEEGVSGKESCGPHWERLHGLFPHSMKRLWDHKPALFVSFGSPFLLFHAPECRTFVNAYCALPVMQEAVVAALLGQVAFVGVNPVDPFCGLREARF